MNILLVAPYRLAGQGGINTVVTRLHEALRARGHQALVLLAGDADDPVPVPGRPATHALYLRGLWPEGARLKGCLAFFLRLPATLWRLRRFLQRERIQVVHLHFPTPSSLYFAALRPVSPWRLVLTFHGTDAYALPRRSRFYRALLRLTLGRADLVTAVSSDLLRALRAAFPRLRAPARVILNGNPMLEAGPGDPAAAEGPLPATPDGYILAVGSLIPRKGYDVLMRAVALAQERGHRLDVVIVGGGPEGDRLRALAVQLGIRDLVRLVGEVSHPAMRPLYERARAFVHTAREEAFGLVLLEAMSCGKAVIATRVGGIPDFIRDGETGLLVDPDDPEALADSLIRLEKDEALRVSLGVRGREIATREHTWDHYTEDTLGAYRAALAGEPEAPGCAAEVPAPETAATADVSVVIPTRNRADLLERLLRSVAASRVSPGITWELVVCDNGSTDATRRVVSEMAAAMPVRVRYVHEPRPGLSVARNTAIRAAAGRVIAFTDDDCVIPETWVEAMWREFDADPDLAMLAGRVEPLTPADGIGGTKHFSRRMTVSLAGFATGRIAGCNMAIRRSAIARVGWFDVDLGAGALGGSEDSDYLYRVLRKQLKAVLAPEVVVYHGHGRNARQLARTERGYYRGTGGFYVKHFLGGDRSVAPRAYWDLRSLGREAWEKLRGGRLPGDEAAAAAAMLSGGLAMLWRRGLRPRARPAVER